MKGAVVFYQLNAKFLERAEDIPENAKQVMYYSLAIGHHVGVFDCFKAVLRCTDAVFERVLAALAPSGDAHRKLTGLLRFGEIVIDRSHVAMLRAAIPEALRRTDMEASAWLRGLDEALDVIVEEPVVYLMGRHLS